jgi:hemoglobin
MFERYGGFSRISRIVSTFYDLVLDSPMLGPYFANTDMRRLIDH